MRSSSEKRQSGTCDLAPTLGATTKTRRGWGTLIPGKTNRAQAELEGSGR